MKLFRKIILVVLILVGLTAGIAKIMQHPEESAFYLGAGFNQTALILLGAVQLAAALLMIFRHSRQAGAILLAATFFISTVVIFMAGKYLYGLFSILPILLTGTIIRDGKSG